MTPYYQEHGITIYHGDVFEVLGAAGSFDALLTDPPYSSGGIFRSDRTALKPTEKYSRAATVAYRHFGGDNRDQRSYLAWLSLWIGLAGHSIADGGSLCIFSDWRQLATTTDAVQAGGFVFRGIGTWHKRGGKPTKGCFRAGSEFVVHGTWGRHTHECYPDSVPKPFRWPNHPITAGEFYALITRSKFRTAAKRISLNRGDDIWTCYRCGEPIPYGRRNVRVVNAREAKGSFLPFSRLALAHWICDDLNVRANGSEWIRRPPRPSESAARSRT
ncbi:MAG: hypothetical protein OXH66_10075 [Gemmatimonadetes bacterium]|nr:hypothetical protein [Gemmatimonadota bacterium]